MDQLKTVMAVIKRHHFWVLCGAVVAVALGLWWVSTGSVAGAVESRMAEIEAARGKTASVLNVADHPNQKSIDATNAETEKLKKKIYRAWERLYEEQKKNNPLPKVLGEAFKIVFEVDPEAEIPGKNREDYWAFIGQHIETLPEMVDYLHPAPVDEENPNPDAPGYGAPPGGGPGGRYFAPEMGPGGGAEFDGRTGGGFAGGAGDGGQYATRMIGVVDWALADRLQLKSHFTWGGRPSTQQVRLAQEDLWVYEALLRIIKNTNGPVKSYREAPIKQIQALQIGRDAAAAFRGSGNSMLSSEGSGAAGGGAELESHQAPEAAPEYDGPTGAGGAAGAYPGPGGSFDGQAEMLTQGRYVNQEGQPLGADDDPPYAEFNLMPIRMLLVIDQTKLAKLLVECANSSMPIEVRRVRVGMDQGAMLNMGMPAEVMGPGGGGRSYGPGPGGPGYEGGRGEFDGNVYGPGSYGHGFYGPGGSSGPGGAAQSRTLDVPVEILGTICIYNPPDEDKLGTGAAAEQPPEVTPAETPAVTPAAAPVPVGGAPPAAPAAGGQPPATGQ